MGCDALTAWLSERFTVTVWMPSPPRVRLWELATNREFELRLYGTTALVEFGALLGRPVVELLDEVAPRADGRPWSRVRREAAGALVDALTRLGREAVVAELECHEVPDQAALLRLIGRAAARQRRPGRAGTP